MRCEEWIGSTFSLADLSSPEWLQVSRGNSGSRDKHRQQRGSLRRARVAPVNNAGLMRDF